MGIAIIYIGLYWTNSFLFLLLDWQKGKAICRQKRSDISFLNLHLSEQKN